jgi:hypothetical protein
MQWRCQRILLALPASSSAVDGFGVLPRRRIRVNAAFNLIGLFLIVAGVIQERYGSS